MELKEALLILDPATRDEALAAYAGDCAMRSAAVEDACRVVCAWVREQLAAEKNEPLTLEELQEMDGKPVWITPGRFWALVYSRKGERVVLICNDGEIAFADRQIEFCGPVYRRPPEGKQ